MVKNQINTLYLWVWMLLKQGLQHYYEASLDEKMEVPCSWNLIVHSTGRCAHGQGEMN